ncbi:MAG: hypothetical protein ACJA09_000903 [Alcanivorax sp.]|jgi:hypothetical protein
MLSIPPLHDPRDFCRFHSYRLLYRARGRLTWIAQGQKGLGKLVEEFNSRNIILTVAAGRCGTDALSHRIGLLDGVTSIHEPLPHYRFILDKANHDFGLAARFFAHVKVPALLAYKTQTVVESNHLYGKAFFEASIAMGFRPKLIFLRRNAHANAISLLRKNCVPGRTLAGKRYVISPGDNPYLPLAAAQELSDFQLCYWYCLEMHLRHELYQKVCREMGILSAALHTEDLNFPERLKSMARAIGLVESETDLSSFDSPEINRVVNAAAKHKRVGLDFDVEDQASQVEQRLGKPASIEEVYRRIETIKRRVGT